jgi:MFS family permease
MPILLASLFVFCSGFAIMVLEIIGARFLIKDFGSSIDVWTSQIGVILIALAAGYYIGGALGDRFRRASFLVWLLAPAGIFILLIPDFSPRIIDWIIMRHPLDEPIPVVWQKFDPAIGSALIFLLPCSVLAMSSPYMIRLVARRITHVGRISGLIYGAATVGSIAGVFVSGYVLIDLRPIPEIFRATGVVTILLGAASLFMDRWLRDERKLNETE